MTTGSSGPSPQCWQALSAEAPRRHVWRAPAAVVVAGTLALAACGGSGGSASGKGKATVSTASAPTFVYSDNDIFASSRSYNIYNPAFPAQAQNLVVLPLAIQTARSISSYVPEVAQSWQVKGSTITMQIRSMKWQTGQPVTSTDVVDSELLAGLAANPIWQDIANVRASGPKQVVFTLASGVAPVVAEAAIMATFVVPAQQYHQFITPGLDKLVTSYYQLDRLHPNSAPTSATGHTISADFSSLDKYNPSSIIGDGPFVWKSWTTSNALLTKSPTFFAAKNVHVPVFEYQEVSSAATAGAVLGGTATIDTAGLPWTIYQKELTLPHQHIYAPPGYEQFQLLFNNRTGPTSVTAVRQAIVHVIHRPSMLKLVYGPHPYYHYIQRPSVVYYKGETTYLTKAQIDSLNPYTYSPSMATSLLEKAGYHKVNGEWMQPNGKQFTLTESVPSGFTNVILLFKTFASWLTAFGIKTSEIVVPYAQFTADQTQGQFEMSFYYGGLYLDPLQFIATTLGPTMNYPTLGAYKGDTGIGFGPTMTVPGIGKVNVSATINAESTSVSPGPTMNKLVYDWARLVNQKLPFYSYIDKNYPLQFSTKQYVGWPAQSSYMWVVTAMNQHAGLTVMMENGYIRPRG